MRNYLITGGAGFIGSNLVEALLRSGKAVRVLDNLETGYMANLERFNGEIEFIEADLRDADAVRRAVAGMDVVLHQAALVSVPRSVADPLNANEVNVTGTLNVLLAARDAGVSRVVIASSSSVYGDSPTLPKVETMVVEPISPYGVSKLAAERYCTAFTAVYGLPTVALRYFNVFGPRQDPQSAYAAVIPRFLTAMLHGNAPTIYGDGRQSRDFTYIDNVVEANLLAAEAPAEVSGYFNVACGDRISLLELVAHLNAILGTDLAPVYEAPRAGDVRDSQADITKIGDALGYTPVVPFGEGLARTVEYFKGSELRTSRRRGLR
ncbi:MAG: SDR family oxidoreductase [Chloroflexia bacterium]